MLIPGRASGTRYHRRLKLSTSEISSNNVSLKFSSLRITFTPKIKWGNLLDMRQPTNMTQEIKKGNLPFHRSKKEKEQMLSLSVTQATISFMAQ